VFLGQARRPFTKWQLQDAVEVDTLQDGGASRRRAGETEVVAETLDKNGKVLGRWVAEWERRPDAPPHVLIGRASSRGRMVGYFNVHEELLKP